MSCDAREDATVARQATLSSRFDLCTSGALGQLATRQLARHLRQRPKGSPAQAWRDRECLRLVAESTHVIRLPGAQS
jgi:hypothetical protein